MHSFDFPLINKERLFTIKQLLTSNLQFAVYNQKANSNQQL